MADFVLYFEQKVSYMLHLQSRTMCINALGRAYDILKIENQKSMHQQRHERIIN